MYMIGQDDPGRQVVEMEHVLPVSERVSDQPRDSRIFEPQRSRFDAIQNAIQLHELFTARDRFEARRDFPRQRSV